MKTMKLFSRLLIAMLAVCVLGTGCESDVDDVNVVASYTVTFETNGGTTISDLTTDGGSTISVPSTPEMEGYTFDNWYLDDTFEALYDFESAVTGDFTLYAKWSVNSYTVSFFTYADDEDNAIADQTVDYGGQVSEPATEPEMAGYQFGGWYTDDATFTEAWDFATDVMGVGDMTLYAKWEAVSYTVTFYYNNGTTDSRVRSVEAFETTSALSPAPTYTGYTLVGWCETADGSGSEFDFATEITADLDLYAKWSVNSHTVSFFTYADDTTNEIADQTVDYAAFVEEPSATPTRSGYEFVDWFTTEGCEAGTEWDFDADVMGDDDMTLYAGWAAGTYTVTFHYNDGVTANTTADVYCDFTFSAPTDLPTEVGRCITGWYTDDATFENEWDFATDVMVDYDLDLYAKWEVETFAITYYSTTSNDYTTLPAAYYTYVVEYDNEITNEVTDDPTDVAYDFMGWYSDAACTTAYTFGSKATSAVDIYAKWAIKTFEVTFNMGAGGGSEATQTINYGGYATEPTTPSDTNEYIFDGWYTDDTYATSFTFATTPITAVTVVYAKWVKIVGTATLYNVVGNETMDAYASNSGTAITQTLLEGGCVDTQVVVGSDLYNFVGWYTSENFADGVAYDFTTVATGDVTLYAKWVAKVFATVSFDSGDGGSAVESQSVEVGYYATSPENPTKDNAVFQGWYYNETLFGFETTAISEDITLTAEWLAVDYVISTEADLIAFRDAVNDGTATSAVAVMTTDITISEANWTPIGTSTSIYFNGTFDGGGYSVSGLNIYAETAYHGLFGAVYGATIKNVTILEPCVESTYVSTAGYSNVAALVGGVYNGTATLTIENCTVSGGTITGAGGYVGGLVGATFGSHTLIMTNCVIDGTTVSSGKGYVGGFVGQSNNDATVFTNCVNNGAVVNTGGTATLYTGGFVGYTTKSLTFIACRNNGTVTSSGKHNGGIIGGATTTPTLIGCCNTGDITSTSTNSGGMIGYITGASKFYACYNTGTITASSDAGALFGSSTSNAASAKAEDFFYLNTNGVAGTDNRSDTSGALPVSSIIGLNSAVETMNANSTLTTYGYKYQVIDDDTPPAIVAR